MDIGYKFNPLLVEGRGSGSPSIVFFWQKKFRCGTPELAYLLLPVLSQLFSASFGILLTNEYRSPTLPTKTGRSPQLKIEYRDIIVYYRNCIKYYFDRFWTLYVQ